MEKRRMETDTHIHPITEASEGRVLHPDLGRPTSLLEYLRIFLTGFAMGAADIVPGVSGGTMAFILGVYETLINAIKSFDLTAVRLAIGLKIRELFEHIPFRFLITLGAGLLAAIILLANALHTLLAEQPTFLFAFFAGLIVASVVAVALKVRWALLPLVALVLATVFAFWLVGLGTGVVENAVQTGEALVYTPSPLPVLFFSGMIAICAMLLPGISGSFVLLILGQYAVVLGAVTNRDIISLAAVALGAVIGLLLFSRVISWLLRRYEAITIAALVGFMIGSLRLIYTEAAAGVQIINPQTSQLDGGQWALVIILFLAGFVLVTVLDHAQDRQNPLLRWLWR
jgi:putative membrane protein